MHVAAQPEPERDRRVEVRPAAAPERRDGHQRREDPEGQADRREPKVGREDPRRRGLVRHERDDREADEELRRGARELARPLGDVQPASIPSHRRAAPRRRRHRAGAPATH